MNRIRFCGALGVYVALCAGASFANDEVGAIRREANGLAASTEPRVEGLKASVDATRDGSAWRIIVKAENKAATNVSFKLVLSAEPRFVATRYLIPGTLYNGNAFGGWQEGSEPWIFAGDRSAIPACTISENANEVFALFASDSDSRSLAASSSLERLPDGSFRHLIYWPVTEAPFSYTDKNRLSPRHDTYLTLRPGETVRVDAFACRGIPPWPNYGFAAVFPQAWRLLKHETKAQKSVAETMRLDSAFLKWSRRRTAEGLSFANGLGDMTADLVDRDAVTSAEGYSLADYEWDFTLDRWSDDDVEKAKQLKPGEYLGCPCTGENGLLSLVLQKARVTVACGLKEGNDEDLSFGLEVLRNVIRSRQRPNGFFGRNQVRKGGETFVDASEVGWTLSELSRTAELLMAHGRDAGEFAKAAERLAGAILKAQPGDGGLGSVWDFGTGRLVSSAGDCGGFVLMGLVRYWRLTGDTAARAAIERAFNHYFRSDIDRFECRDAAADCPSVNRDGIQPFLSAAVEMYRATKDSKYLEWARKAGWYFLSWVYLQNPSYGPDTDLSIFNWRPAGSTLVGTARPSLDDCGGLLIPELMALAEADGNSLWSEVAALIWRNGTQGFAFEGREAWHSLERPIGAKQEAWYPTRWSPYRTGEQKRGSLDDRLVSQGGVHRLAALLEVGESGRNWLASVAPVETEVTLSNRLGTARVELRGANMRSWRPTGRREVLGRLGVPIYWPWAVYEGDPGCDIHGLTPYFDWTVVERSSDRVLLTLEDNEATRRVWPHRFHAEMEYRLGTKLEAEFRVTNTDGVPYSCTELLHPFFNVSHPTNCIVEGVDGAKYFWLPEAEKGSDRVWRGTFPVGRILGGKPGVLFGRGDGAFALVDRDRCINAEFRGGVKFVVYAAPDGGVSLETGAIYRDCAYVLKPGETHRVGVTLSVVEASVPGK